MNYSATVQQLTNFINAYYTANNVSSPKISNFYFSEKIFTKRVSGTVKEIKKTTTTFMLDVIPDAPSFAFDIRRVLQEALGYTIKSVVVNYNGAHVIVEAE